MMLRWILPLCLLLLLCACAAEPEGIATPTQGETPEPMETPEPTPSPTPYVLRYGEGMSLKERYAPPQGYTRIEAQADSFAAWLRDMPLREDGSPVMLRGDGTIKPGSGFDSVVDVEIRSKQMEKTDFLLSLRASYLYSQQRYAEMVFHFYSGFSFSFDTWSDGNRIKLSGNDVVWEKKGEPDASQDVFQSYLFELHIYCNPTALQKDVTSIDEALPGALLVQPVSGGKSWENALMIADMAMDSTGKTALLLAGCGKPEQDGYILSNPLDPVNAPWFILPDNGILETPEGTYSITNLYAFPS